MKQEKVLSSFLLSWMLQEEADTCVHEANGTPRTAEGASPPRHYRGANQSLCCPLPCFLYKQYFSFWLQEHSAKSLIRSQREMRAGDTESLKGCQETYLCKHLFPQTMLGPRYKKDTKVEWEQRTWGLDSEGDLEGTEDPGAGSQGGKAVTAGVCF